MITKDESLLLLKDPDGVTALIGVHDVQLTMAEGVGDMPQSAYYHRDSIATLRENPSHYTITESDISMMSVDHDALRALQSIYKKMPQDHTDRIAELEKEIIKIEAEW